ncbi:tRNA uridine-5-carboxymethylaminomethyl(34) synthesis GTPase MnmE [Aquibium oceanicum]|uniref:tRNA modification GTPase MnmE n=1 Tax=Aquibium oceanicum TaxID=1670800 RepID=A0A1L3SLN4_9HYPH|nr:tRNA uridine-5-carboxymethylaminomethyl(34) synthesis GTPase MnmE [Aquibium oceanicum]APH70271.1 tRNA uridine-5-carboxymethylaminomethyl(34) synthesis GTPase MnmE [Aquibium oceanicum]
MFRDTIYALSSGNLPSAVAVVRLSGPHVREVLTTLVGSVPEPRQLVLATLRDLDGGVIDRGFVSYFAAPASFTGDDSAEFQVHGSIAVIAALFRTFAALPGLRTAEAGEFARRAHVNGKFDLTGAEALADLIEAETEAQRRFAIANASGRTSELYQSWRERIIHARAMIEAELDFSDEEDIPGAVGSTVWAGIAELRVEILEHIKGYRTSEIIRNGYQVALIGLPNAGKSSLLNALIRRDAAIVSEEPGTTRDLVVVNLDLCGVKVVLTDTAGLREGAGPVEQQGIERAREAGRSAQLVLRLHDLSASSDTTVQDRFENEIKVGTKSDLVGYSDLTTIEVGPLADLKVSAKTGAGLEALLERIREHAVTAVSTSQNLIPFRERHVAQLVEAERLLGNALTEDSLDLELKAELMRRASLALGRIIGDVDVEDVLDVIFSRFCIGK